MKKIISTLLAIIMVLTMIPIASLAVFAESEVTKISSAADFLAMTTGNYELVGNIDLGGATYSAAQIALSDATLDGNGHSVTGFTLNGEGDISLMTLSGTVSIRNLTIGAYGTPISITTTGTNGANIGVIAAVTSATVTIENVDAYANITASADATAFHHVGGLLGSVSGATTVKDCSFNGSVTAYSNATNATSNNGSGSGAAAGIVGKMSDANATLSVRNCVNNAAVNGDQNVGGMVGITLTKKVEISKCVNNGALKAEGYYVGGMLGGLTRPTTGETETGIFDFDITSCVNNGSLENGGKYAGGILGIAGAHIKNNSERGDNTDYALVLSECENNGDVTSTSEAIGGMIGIIRFGSTVLVDRCANYGNISGTNKVTGCVGEGNVFAGGAITIQSSLNAGNATASGKQAGGFMGWSGNNPAPFVYNACINLGTISAVTNEVGGISACDASGDVAAVNCISVGAVSGATIVPTVKVVNAQKSSGCAWYNPLVTDSTVKDVMGNAPLASLEAALAILNTATYTRVWGNFVLNSTGTAIIRGTPTLVGVQRANAPVDDEYSVRFIAAIGDSLRYSEVGFKVSVNGGEESKVSTNKVYENISSTVNTQKVTVTANELGGKYVYAVKVTEIPVNGDYTFVITPYAKGLVPTEGEPLEYVGESYTVTCHDGVVVSVSVLQSAAQ